MELTDDCVRSFALGRVFKDKPDRINSLDFHRVHDLAVTAGDDDAIHLYDTLSGSRKKTCFSKKYGVSNAVFTHHTNAILYASTRGTDHALRYLSLHDNKYLRYFPGHRGRVGHTDTILTAAADCMDNRIVISVSPLSGDERVHVAEGRHIHFYCV